MMLQLVFVLVLQILFAAAQCPTGTMPYKSSCYHVSHDKEEWFNAQFICKEFLKGYLVEVNDQAENNFLMNITMGKAYPYWLGINDILVKGAWKLASSNTDLSFTQWGQGEPNNFKGAENCAGLIGQGKWEDLPCQIPVKFICESPQMK